MRALLVEHGSNRGSLAAARSLHRAGWTVDLISSGTSLTASSRVVRSRTTVDYPACGPDGLVHAVHGAVRSGDIDLVLPVDESQLLALSARRDELGARLPYPPHDVVVLATDRLEQARAAAKAGLSTPRTETAVPPGADRVAVKARTPALLSGNGGWGRFETHIGAVDDARGWVAELEAAGVGAVVQEVIEGDLCSLTVLTGDDGRPLGLVQQSAERIWPPGAGTSTRAATVPVDPDLSRGVLALLDGLGWSGFVQLQFLVDRNGTMHLIDFNPRFYGSLALAVCAGVDFPVLWAAEATGQGGRAVVTARPRTRYQWLGGDVRRALRERRGGLLRDLASTALWGGPGSYPVWSVRDPAPALASTMGLLARRLRY